LRVAQRFDLHEGSGLRVVLSDLRVEREHARFTLRTYGPSNEVQAVKALSAGSFYTETASVPHFARTGREGAVVVITGYGPSDTVCMSSSQ
jgi:hypothetical protein